MKHIEDNNYENMFWGYAENEKDFIDFLLSLWNKRGYERYRGVVISSNNVFQNEELTFFDKIKAKFPDDCEEYPSPTETDKYIIDKKPKESEYPVVLLYDATNDIDSVFTWVSLNEFKRRNTMNLEIILEEALRQWEEFIYYRADCTLKDYNDFVLEIAKQMEDNIDE